MRRQGHKTKNHKKKKLSQKHTHKITNITLISETKFTLVTVLCDVGVTKPGEPLDALFAARVPFTFVG